VKEKNDKKGLKNPIEYLAVDTQNISAASSDNIC
jgi:hypothetical protein